MTFIAKKKTLRFSMFSFQYQDQLRNQRREGLVDKPPPELFELTSIGFNYTLMYPSGQNKRNTLFSQVYFSTILNRVHIYSVDTSSMAS